MTNLSKSIHLWILLVLLGAGSVWAQTQNAPVIKSSYFFERSFATKIIGLTDGGSAVVTAEYDGISNFKMTKLSRTGTPEWQSTLYGALVQNFYEPIIEFKASVKTNDGGVAYLGRDRLGWFMVRLNSGGQRLWYKHLADYYPIGVMNTAVLEDMVQTTSGSFAIIGWTVLPGNGTVATVTLVEGTGQSLINKSIRSQYGGSKSQTLGYTIANFNNGLVLAGFHNDDESSTPPRAWIAFVDLELTVKWQDRYNWFTYITNISVNESAKTIVCTGPGIQQNITAATVFDKDGLVRGAVVFLDKSRNQSYSASITNPENNQQYIIADITDDEAGSIRLTAYDNRLVNRLWQKTFGGSLSDALIGLGVSNGDLTVYASTKSADGDLRNRGYQNNNIEAAWVFSLGATTSPSSPPVGTFALTAPGYDCNTGQLTLNTSGGNGSAIDFRIVGNRDWASSNSFSIPAHQRNGTTFTLEARQNGQVVSLGFTTACGTTTPPSTTTTTPPSTTLPGGDFVVVGPAYDCNTGQLTAQVANVGGASVEYRIIGLRDWGSSPAFTVPSHQRNDTRFTIEARISTGAYASFNFRSSCEANTPPIVTPPTRFTPLTVGLVTLDCNTGALVINNTNGGTAALVEFQIPGLGAWQASNTFFVPTYQRRNVTFMINARQSGLSLPAPVPFTTNCPNTARVASPEMGQRWSVEVLGNPVEDQVQLRLSGLVDQTVDLSLIDGNGRVLTECQVSVQTEGQTETLRLSGSAGVYVLRAISQRQQQTLKVLKK